MPYDEKVDARIAEVVEGWGATKKKMFGGTCYLLAGNMMCGVYRDKLILRLGEAQAAAALRRPHVSAFDITGRAMKGWVMVEGAGFKGAALGRWLGQARDHAGALPPE